MANPTRFTKVGYTKGGKFGENVGDYYTRTYTAPVTLVASAAEQDTGIQLPPGVVLGTSIKVNTAEVTGLTKEVDVGVSGVSSTYLATNLNVSATGFKPAIPGQAIDTAANLTYTLGSADFAELEAEIVVYMIASDN